MKTRKELLHIGVMTFSYSKGIKKDNYCIEKDGIYFLNYRDYNRLKKMQDPDEVKAFFRQITMAQEIKRAD